MLTNLKERAVSFYNNARGYFQSAAVSTQDKVILGFALFAAAAGAIGLFTSGGLLNLLLVVAGLSVAVMKLRA